MSVSLCILLPAYLESYCAPQGAAVAPSGESAFFPGVSEEVMRDGLSLCKEKVKRMRESLLSRA